MSVNVVLRGRVASSSSSRLKLDRPEPVVVNPKSLGSFGCASLMIVIEPRLVLVNVHLTVSPASSLNVAVRSATLTVLGCELWPSSQSMAVRSNGGAGLVSVEV